MKPEDLVAWSAAIGPFDDRHYCGRDLTVAEVKRAVATMVAATKSYVAKLRSKQAAVAAAQVEVPEDVEAAIIAATTDQTRPDAGGHDAVTAGLLRAAIARAIAAAEDARDTEWQKRIAPLHPGRTGDGCESGDPIDWTVAALRLTLNDLEDAADRRGAQDAGARDPMMRRRKCESCGKLTRITTAGCDHCDLEDK